MQFEPISTVPVPIWYSAIDADTYEHRPPLSELDLVKAFDLVKQWPEFRGVNLGRLPTIVKTGIDVDPTTAPIFVSDFHKAWEYGAWPKVIMALDRRHLDRTYREVTADTAPDELARLTNDYPTRIESRTGDRIRLTRFSETDPRAATPYETEYARWIPGNPFEALLAVFVFSPTEGLSTRLA